MPFNIISIAKISETIYNCNVLNEIGNKETTQNQRK